MDANSPDLDQNPCNIQITFTATEKAKWIKINKYFDVSDYYIDWWDGSSMSLAKYTVDNYETNNSINQIHKYDTPWDYTITLINPGERWKFNKDNWRPLTLIPYYINEDWDTSYYDDDSCYNDEWENTCYEQTDIEITYMPTLSDRFGPSATNAWDNYFGSFNSWVWSGPWEKWAITAVVAKLSFDTSNLTSVWDSFFESFNSNWLLEYLPIWSFDTSNISTIWDGFFSSFNNWTETTVWWLLKLPKNSFKLSTNLNEVWYGFFTYFNQNGSISELPAWSFNTENIKNENGWFFERFNETWSLEKLPAWSFRFSSDLKQVNDSFFDAFNWDWNINLLPAWSFNTSNIEQVWDDFFSLFNSDWSLVWLPAWSFSTENIKQVWDDFFRWFNSDWLLEKLPAWSFRLNEDLKTVWSSFFQMFNQWWSLQSLPAWSFNTSNISTAWYWGTLNTSMMIDEV